MFTEGFSNILRGISIDWLCYVAFAAVYPEVHELFGRPDFTYEYLLDIPRAADGDYASWGVYLDYVTRTDVYGLYIGTGTSTKGSVGALLNYYAQLKHTARLGDLRESERRVRHLRYAFESDATMNMRLLARFPPTTPRVAVLLAEGLFMVYLNSVDYIPHWINTGDIRTFARNNTLQNILQAPTKLNQHPLVNTTSEDCSTAHPKQGRPHLNKHNCPSRKKPLSNIARL